MAKSERKRKPVMTETDVTALIPDDKNFNRGTIYGGKLMTDSFQKFGAGRSVLIDKNNRLISGNKSTEHFVETGGSNVVIVDVDGDTLVAVRRNDIDLDSPMGREMALADNATAVANIEFATDVIETVVGGEIAENWGVEIIGTDPIDPRLVGNFNEGVNFIIKCESMDELRQLQTSFNTTGQRISFNDFIKKTATS